MRLYAMNRLFIQKIAVLTMITCLFYCLSGCQSNSNANRNDAVIDQAVEGSSGGQKSEVENKNPVKVDDTSTVEEPDEKEEKVEAESYNIPICEGSTRISQTNCEIIIANSQNAKNVYKNSISMSFCSDKIIGGLYARSRLPQDKILMGGMHKSVKKLMCDKKIPIELRARLPIICDEEGILAIPLVGIRDRAKGDSLHITVTVH